MEKKLFKTKCANDLTAGSRWRHKVEKVERGIFKGKEKVTFNIQIRRGNGGPHVNLFCTVWENNDDLNLADGDSILVNQILRVAASDKGTGLAIFVTLGDIEVIKKPEQQYSEGDYPIIKDDEIEVPDE